MHVTNLVTDEILTQVPFITEDFLLQSETAKHLYHSYAKSLPIIDYHNHLSPEYLALNKKFDNISDIWLSTDHYKWRAMRSLGIDEKYITGDASSWDKFRMWAEAMPQLIRNPLFHWSHLELKNSFGIDEYLRPSTAKSIYEQCNDLLQKDDLSVHGILDNYKVQVVATTDDPVDNLQFHTQMKLNQIPFIAAPTFRPDKVFSIENKQSFLKYLRELSSVSGVEIHSLDSLLEAYRRRIQFFHENGCRISDHGLILMPTTFKWGLEQDNALKSYLSNDSFNTFAFAENFRGVVLLELCKIYHEFGWVQQFHLGPIRNTNSRLMDKLGADAGVDSIGDYQQAPSLAAFLNELDKKDQLAKTILYNINPADNEIFAAMAGNFNDGKVRGKVQYGAAWWFLDQKEGIEKQLNALSNMGTISTFIGMLTDSRSFLSFSRHEYFRRILCNMFGDDMEKGIIPNDIIWIGRIIENICYYNAKTYFGF